MLHHGDHLGPTLSFIFEHPCSNNPLVLSRCLNKVCPTRSALCVSMILAGFLLAKGCLFLTHLLCPNPTFHAPIRRATPSDGQRLGSSLRRSLIRLPRRSLAVLLQRLLEAISGHPPCTPGKARKARMKMRDPCLASGSPQNNRHGPGTRGSPLCGQEDKQTQRGGLKRLALVSCSMCGSTLSFLVQKPLCK